MTISPHVLYAGEDVTATTTAQTAYCAAPGGTPGQSWSWQYVPGTVVSGCTEDSSTCVWKTGATGGWAEYCMSGAAWVGSWDSCDYYGAVGGAPTISVSVSPGSIKADGKSTTTVTATVSDTGSPESGDDISFSSSDDGQSVGAVTDNGDGTYTATITASKTSGNATITASDTSSSPTATATTTLTSTPTTVSTTTGVTCAAQASPAGTFSCTATVAPSSATDGYLPSGSVDWSSPSGTYSASSCPLDAGSVQSADCTVTYTPDATGDASGATVTGTFAPSGVGIASTGTASIPAVGISAAAPKPTNTFLEGSAEAAFVVTLSRPASVPVTVDYEAADGSAPDGLKQSEGDYAKTSGTLTFAPGTTSQTVNVKVFADIKVRVDGDVDLVLSSPSAAEFDDTAAAASRSFAQLRPRAPSASPLTVSGQVRPHLEVGVILGRYLSPKARIRHYDQTTYSRLRAGDKIYIGDEIRLTGPDDTAAGIDFMLGGSAVLKGTNGPGHWHVADVRHLTYTFDSSYDAVVTILKQKVEIWDQVSHQKGTMQVQTNAGVMGIKG